MADVDFRILGPLEVWHAGRQVDVAGARQRALLAVLLLHGGAAVSSDRLIDDVWEDRPPEAGATALRVRISQLRRALGPAGELLVTSPPGYALRAGPDEVDLRRFERLSGDAERALARDDPATASDLLREALALWRGPALADFAYASFAQAAIARLDDLRLAAVELRVDADLRLGRHAGVIGELRALVDEHPLRERPCGQLMVALYRDGRQAEALETYRAARRRLVEDVGLEPGPDLQALERRILAQDPALGTDGAAPAPSRAPSRTILVVPGHETGVEALAALAAPLAARGHELLIAALVDDPAQLGASAARLHAVRERVAQSGVPARVAAFTSADRAADTIRLALEEEAALLLLDAPDDLAAVAGGVATVLARAVCDVGLVVGADRPAAGDGAAIVVPFGGHEHDWAAAQLGAWFATALERPLRLVGVGADPVAGRRDASRLLGSASLALQRALHVAAEPLLVEGGTDGIVGAARDAALVVAGLSDRWAREGLGPARTELARRAAPPVVLVRRGLRPGGLAPARALTRFTWSAG